MRRALRQGRRRNLRPEPGLNVVKTRETLRPALFPVKREKAEDGQPPQAAGPPRQTGAEDHRRANRNGHKEKRTRRIARRGPYRTARQTFSAPLPVPPPEKRALVGKFPNLGKAVLQLLTHSGDERRGLRTEMLVMPEQNAVVHRRQDAVQRIGAQPFAEIAVFAGHEAQLVHDGHAHAHGHDHSGGHARWAIVRSALIHTVQVTFFILVVTFAFGLLIEYVGQDALGALLANHPVRATFVAALVGLVPNCGASVAITELYLDGVLAAGPMLAGLLASGGVGLLVLWRTNAGARQNAVITAFVYVVAVVAGLAVGALGILF